VPVGDILSLAVRANRGEGKGLRLFLPREGEKGKKKVREDFPLLFQRIGGEEGGFPSSRGQERERGKKERPA